MFTITFRLSKQVSIILFIANHGATHRVSQHTSATLISWNKADCKSVPQPRSSRRLVSPQLYHTRVFPWFRSIDRSIVRSSLMRYAFYEDGERTGFRFDRFVVKSENRDCVGGSISSVPILRL